MNKDSYTPCTKCGRPMRYCKGECCGKKPEGCDCREYGCKHNACIREKNPDCPYEAVIPSVTVETINNLKDLADCFVHVEDINTTFYIDDKHRIMVTWAGLVSADDYDFDTNPLNVRSQIIYDAKNNKAAIYDNKGAHYIFQISDIENDYMLLENKPAINGVTLEGNKTAAQLGILEAEETALMFDTVSDMKASTKIKNGGYARTLGFHAINDGGAAIYKITDSGTANEMDVIAVGDLCANLVANEEYNAKQFGAKGNGSADDTAKLQRAVDVTSTAKGRLVISDGTYMVDATTSIILKSDIVVDFVNAEIKAIANSEERYKVLYAENVSNIVLNNPVIEGDRENHTGATGEWGHALACKGNVHHITINNARFFNCWGDGAAFSRGLIEGVSYIPNHIYFNGVTSIENVRRNGISILAGNHIYFDVLQCKKIDGTAPMAGIDLESEHGVDEIGDIYINVLNVDNSEKAFTLRNRGLINGNIHIGTISHTNKRPGNPLAPASFVPSFRTMFEYFDSRQAKYSVSVDNIYTESQLIQVENLYNDVTPQVIVGNIHCNTRWFISSTTPATTRSYIDLIYNMTTDTSTTLGGLIVDNILVDEAKEQDGNTVSNNRPFKLTYSGSASLSTLKATNIHIGKIRVNKVSEELTPNISTSNVLCENVDINFEPLAPKIERRDSGTLNYQCSGENDVYMMPASDGTTLKTLNLRVQNILQRFKVYLTGNSKLQINTAYATTQFSKVYLNGSEITGTDGAYTIGTYANGGSFYIYTAGSYIYVEQLS